MPKSFAITPFRRLPYSPKNMCPESIDRDNAVPGAGHVRANKLVITSWPFLSTI